MAAFLLKTADSEGFDWLSQRCMKEKQQSVFRLTAFDALLRPASVRQLARHDEPAASSDRFVVGVLGRQEGDDGCKSGREKGWSAEAQIRDRES